MKSLVFAALCAAASAVATAASAQSAQIERVEILNFGIYSGKATEHADRTGTPAGINVVVNRKLIKQTETIPARIGARFGVEYVVRGHPQDKDVTFTCITRFPPKGVVNSKGEKFTKSEFNCDGTIGAKAVRTYTFDHTWELVPGTWSLEFYAEGRKVGGKIFNVVAE